MSEKLKPCPVCGQSGTIEDTEGCDYVVRCGSCEYFVHDDMDWDTEGYNGKQNAINKWNNQPQINLLQSEIDRLKEENAELVEALENAVKTFEHLVKIASVQTEVINPELGQNFKIENDVSVLADICYEVGEFKELLAKARGEK